MKTITIKFFLIFYRKYRKHGTTSVFAGQYDKNSDIYSVYKLNEPTHVLANKNTSMYIVGNYLFSSHLIWIAGIHFTKLLFMMSYVPWD